VSGSASSFFAKIKMSRRACEKWLKSPIRHVSDYDDWHGMNPQAAAAPDDVTSSAKLDFMSVDEFLDTLADLSGFFCCEYDDDEGAFFIADVHRKAGGLGDLAVFYAALRGAEAFKDDDEPSFIYVFPESGGDPDALLRIRKGASQFLNPKDASPDVLYFVNEAEEFAESLAEDDMTV
jgi:hypothetical protein